ncbi:MAG: arylsulfatase [Verrucomicrobia bacterium]|nr:arylsulfatase [Verrucomicrobiota bacterium]
MKAVRRGLSLPALWLFLGGAVAAAAAGPPASPERPNVLLILADDLGCSDLGCYGGEIATPNLDALARGGLRFSQFYNTARCWPSRAAILTGYYAQQVRRDTVPGVTSGAQGTRPPWARLLPEMLRPLGYRSYHSGKWHLDGRPMENGFDHSYSLNDHDRHFAPRQHTEDDKPLAPVPSNSGYYTTTAIADHAVQCLREHAQQFAERPFFSYVAFTSPHFPLQAPSEDIARYRDKYLRGWDVMREERWNRMKRLGLVDGALSAVERDLGPPYPYPEAIRSLGSNEVNRPLPWSELSSSQRAFQAAKMAVHAAMVDRMDREIGRVLEQLRSMGALENTLILFLSDNGASAEMMVRGDGHDPDAVCGTGATFLSLGPGWSSMANAPFRRHKTWVHEGGISTPLIIHWPRGFKARDEIRRAPGHVIDLAPTILAAAGATRHPAGDGPPVPPPPGLSLLPLFAKDRPLARESLWWLHEENRALRSGPWKIVASGKSSPWELYDLRNDRAESNNLAARRPRRTRALAVEWQRLTDAFSALARSGMIEEGAPKGQGR